jgi:hypothetical protein
MQLFHESVLSGCEFRTMASRATFIFWRQYSETFLLQIGAADIQQNTADELHFNVTRVTLNLQKWPLIEPAHVFPAVTIKYFAYECCFHPQ